MTFQKNQILQNERGIKYLVIKTGIYRSGRKFDHVSRLYPDGKQDERLIDRRTTKHWNIIGTAYQEEYRHLLR